MKIFVLIPVFNRLPHTKKVLQSLRTQTLYQNLFIIVIDDGSTDGTAEFLQQQPDVLTLVGDGNLWWGGSIQKGLDYVTQLSPTEHDYVLFINNDTWFDRDYVEGLIETSLCNFNAAVGSIIHEPEQIPSLTSIGPKVDINRLAVWDLLSELTAEEKFNLKPVYKVDALSGRGTLYPAKLFEKFGGMRPYLLPHYLADYELAMRFKRNGVPLIVSSKAIVYSPSVFGNDVSHMGWWSRSFSRRSAGNLIYKFWFYVLIGTYCQRLTAPLRWFYFPITRLLRGRII